MTSWYNNLLTKTTSQISSLRSTLLSSDADGDTEDDTHVCRVLRNYYADKGRPFPPWLPPDPKAAAPPPAQTLYSQPQVGSRYGGLGQQGQQQQQQGPGGGALSSLWDSGPAAPPPQQQQSLRAGRLTPGAAAGAGQAGRMGSTGGRDDAVMPRPLPSQRAGSYQSATAASPQPAGSSAQDRLRQRLWGGSSSRTSSPSQSTTGGNGQQGPFQPPSANSVGGGSSKSSNYEDRFAPGGSYDSGRGGGGPYVGANAPWSSGGDEYGGGGGGGRQGLPSGPRRQGLPSGPRGYR